MTKYQGKSFSKYYGSEAYREGWERTFKSEVMAREWEPRDCDRKSFRDCPQFGDDWNCLGYKNGVTPCLIAIKAAQNGEIMPMRVGPAIVNMNALLKLEFDEERFECPRCGGRSESVEYPGTCVECGTVVCPMSAEVNDD